jgi:hypothetical protein
MSTENALAKSNKSVAEHIQKIKTAVSEHCDKMCKAHKAHESAIARSFGLRPEDPSDEPSFNKAAIGAIIRETVEETVAEMQKTGTALQQRGPVSRLRLRKET